MCGRVGRARARESHVDCCSDVGCVRDEVWSLADAERDVVESDELHDVCCFCCADLDAGVSCLRVSYAWIAVQDERPVEEDAEDVPDCPVRLSVMGMVCPFIRHSPQRQRVWRWNRCLRATSQRVLQVYGQICLPVKQRFV